jgi:hypothetical protein
MRALCEYDPVRGRPAKMIPVGRQSNGELSCTSTGCPNEATVSVGANGQWHLCESCAALPYSKRFRKRMPLREA